jgi:hypothetical protein
VEEVISVGKIPRQGDYLTSADVKDGDIVEIVKGPELRTAEETGFDRDVFGVTVLLPNKTSKLWTLNKTTYNACWDVFGDESQSWVGKRVRIAMETRKVRGERKTIIYGEPVVEEHAKQVSLENLSPEQKQQLRQELNQAATETT